MLRQREGGGPPDQGNASVIGRPHTEEEITARTSVEGYEDDLVETAIISSQRRPASGGAPSTPPDAEHDEIGANAEVGEVPDAAAEPARPHGSNAPTAALLALVETALADESDDAPSEPPPVATAEESGLAGQDIETTRSVAILDELLAEEDASAMPPAAAEELSPAPFTAEDLSPAPPPAEELSPAPFTAEDLSPAPLPAGEDPSPAPPLAAEDLSPAPPPAAEDLSPAPPPAEELSPAPFTAEDLSPAPLAAEDLPPAPLPGEVTPIGQGTEEDALPPPAPEVGPPEPPRFSLEGVLALDALSDEQRDELTSLASIEELDIDQEICPTGLVLLLEGTATVQARISDVAAVRLRPGDVVFPEGSLPEALAIRIVATSTRAKIAAWDRDTIHDSLGRCPGLLDELRQASDRMQALAGCSMGPIGDRLDDDLRTTALERLEPRVLEPDEMLVGQGQPVPGLIVVGVGTLQLEDEAGDQGRLGPGEFLFAAQVLGGGQAPANARAGAKGCVILYGARHLAHELLVTCPPLLEILAGM